MWEMQIRSLSQEDPLEKEMVAHSSILAWEIPWTEEPGGLQSMEVTNVRHDLATKPPPLILLPHVRNKAICRMTKIKEWLPFRDYFQNY